MFGKKAKRIKELEGEVKRMQYIYNQDYSKLQIEKYNLRLHNGRLMNELSKLQSQVQRLSPVHGKDGKFIKK